MLASEMREGGEGAGAFAVGFFVGVFPPGEFFGRGLRPVLRAGRLVGFSAKDRELQGVQELQYVQELQELVFERGACGRGGGWV